MNPAGAGAEIRRAAALLREAQAVRRRLEKLATLATDAPPSSKRLLDEALVALQRLTDDLAGTHVTAAGGSSAACPPTQWAWSSKIAMWVPITHPPRRPPARGGATAARVGVPRRPRLLASAASLGTTQPAWSCPRTAPLG